MSCVPAECLAAFVDESVLRLEVAMPYPDKVSGTWVPLGDSEVLQSQCPASKVYLVEEFALVSWQEWPCVCVNIQASPAVTQAHMDGFTKYFCDLLTATKSRGEKIHLLMNLDSLVNASMAQKGMAVGFIKEIQKDNLALESIASTALVVSTVVSRTILSLILKMRPPKTRHAVFPNDWAACEWTRGEQARIHMDTPIESSPH
jgi:hypothetical protein